MVSLAVLLKRRSKKPSRTIGSHSVTSVRISSLTLKVARVRSLYLLLRFSCDTNKAAIGNAELAPCPKRVLLKPICWSLPTHVIITRLGSIPANQPSLLSWVVPVLPARSLVSPYCPRIRDAVPSFTVERIICIIICAVRSLSAGAKTLGLRSHITSPFLFSIRVIK